MFVMLFKATLSFTAYSPLFDMVIYPAICGIVVVVVVMALKVAEAEIIFDLFDTTIEALDAQDKKENQ